MSRKVRKPSLRKGHEKAVSTRSCDWPGCDGEGAHRAPRSRQELNSYYWFCLSHIRSYNTSWNYYDGMNDQEVEADLRNDTVWNRPSWQLGTLDINAAKLAFGFNPDVLANGFANFGESAQNTNPPYDVKADEEHALALLDLRFPLNEVQAKARYKELVKRHHPDANGGDKAAEEKFKQINQAYRTIMKLLSRQECFS
jgi:hypothetical protein